MAKPIIQICFSLKTGLTPEMIEEKLIALRDKLDQKYDKNSYICSSCHLSRALCEEKGFDTAVPDMFERIFGANYVCELDSEPDFATAMQNINEHRTRLAEKADDLVLLSNDQITNVALELELFTRHHVIVL